MTTTKTPDALETTTLELDAITIGDNVRTELGDVTDLAASIEAVGLLNPVTVTMVPIIDEDGEGDLGVRFVLVAGHRRVAAARKLGWSAVPAVVIKGAGEDSGRVAAQLVENLQREDLDPLDEADGIARLVDLLGSQREAAKAIGRSPGHISKRLKLAKLPEPARAGVAAGTIPLDSAYELTKLEEADALEVAESFEKDPNAGKWALQRKTGEADRDANDRKAAKTIAERHPGVEVIAHPDAPKSWKTLEGWDGLAVDHDRHELEPCHRIVAEARGFGAEDGAVGVYYCADPGRHADDGDSDLKTMRTRDDSAREAGLEEARRKAAKRDEARAELNRTIVETVTNLSDRNAVIRALSLATLANADTFGQANAALDTVARAIGIDLPAPPDGSGGAEADEEYFDRIEAITRGEGITVAQLYRLATGVALWSEPWTDLRTGLDLSRNAIGVEIPEGLAR